MARKSRKNITTMPDIASNLLKTAVYIRLSVEDISRCNNIWNSSSILRILYDERYTGTYIMGKTEVKSVGSRGVKHTDESKWYKIPNAHPAIIDKADFDKLQEMLLRFKCPKDKKKQFPLMGKIFCGCCGHAMQRIAKKTPVFSCRYTDVIEDFSCYNLSITEQELSDIIFQILRKQAEVIFALNEVTDTAPLEFTLKQQDLYAKQIADMKALKTRLYEQLMMKEISLDEYKQCKDNIDVKLTLITNSYNNTTQRNDQLLRSQEEKEKRLLVANKITDQKSLTKELVDLLIDQVSVFPNNQIEIAWKIKNFA